MKQRKSIVKKKPVKKIIVISGKIGTGKTTLAKDISTRFNLPVASFSGYLRHYCEKNDLPTDRKTLQEVGKKLVATKPYLFLKHVVLFYKGDSDIIILEGLRHMAIIDHLYKVCDACLFLFLDPDPDITYNRYIERELHSTNVNDYDKFVRHPVELEIDQLKLISNFILKSDDSSKEELFLEVNKFLS